jgi:16S rRNA (adenine1518-N6/adenine1519-N6)-dimethyltransferase
MVKAKKSLGQHFLTNVHTAQQIVDAVDSSAKTIIEIGPGPGILTDRLLKRDAELIFVEKDDAFAAKLAASTEKKENVTVVHEDFLKLDLSLLTSNPNTSIMGNFPYNISSQIVFRMVEYKHLFSELIGMFQLEMAKRIVASPGTKDYGVISVLTQTAYTGSIIIHVGPDEFMPPPRVNSAVIKLVRHDDFSMPCSEKWLRKVVKSAFGQRRKMLRNTLKGYIPQELLITDPLFTKRPEQLTVEVFYELARIAEEHYHSNEEI